MVESGRIAFVHDNFVQYGGAERVAEEIAKLLPQADIMSTVAIEDRLPPNIKARHVKTTWMRHLPALERLYRHYFLLYPLAVRSLDLSAYDIVVSSCVGFAKGVVRAPRAVHVCYCHTPPRWVWRFDDYTARENFNPATALLLRSLLVGVRQIDIHSAEQPDYYIANSNTVAKRIKQFYGRNAVVIHPPVDTSRFHVSEGVDDYFLIVSRLLAYKRIDIAIEACNRTRRRLLIVGDGPDRERLESIAGSTVKFLGHQPDEDVHRLLSRCEAVLFPGEEDFGMVPVEANASGRPVIALAAGGALETVIDGETGVLYKESTVESLVSAINRFRGHSWQGRALRSYSKRFDIAVFRKAFLDVLQDVADLKIAERAAA